MSYNSTLDDFCGTKFWDSEITWYTDNPEFTPCFEKTVLIWIPCLFLWVAALLDTYYILHSKERNIPWNILNISKLIITCLLIVLKFVDLGVSVHKSSKEGDDTKLPEDNVFNAEYYSPIVKILTFGHDTTTSGICFAIYILSQHPEVQEKILEEQRRVLGENLDRDATYSELQQMKYLEQVIKESLRIYPAVPLIERLITKDTDIAGIKVKSDTSIIIDIFHMQRNPELFEDPLEFRPERFDINSNMKNAFSWIPFSAGPRNCIGQKFAMMEMKTTIAGVIKNFIITPVEQDIQLCSDLILKPENGLRVQFKTR